MQRVTLARRFLMLLVLISTAGCLSLDAWKVGGYAVDVSRSAQGASIVGHCFRMLVNASIHAQPNPTMRLELGQGEILDIYGRVYIPEPSSTGQLNLPMGSRIIAERVLDNVTVESNSLTPIFRVTAS